MPSRIPSVRVLMVTARMANGEEIRARGVHSPDLKGEDGFLLELDVRQLPPQIQAEFYAWQRALDEPRVSGLAQLWVPASFVLSTEPIELFSGNKKDPA